MACLSIRNPRQPDRFGSAQQNTHRAGPTGRPLHVAFIGGSDCELGSQVGCSAAHVWLSLGVSMAEDCNRGLGLWPLVRFADRQRRLNLVECVAIRLLTVSSRAHTGRKLAYRRLTPSGP